MGTDSKQLADMVKSGEYFAESRAWYQAMYIGPISERAFFLVIAGLAAAVALIGFMALMLFLPVTDRPALAVRSERVDEVIPKLVPLRQGGMAIDPAIQRFFVSNYVTRRESYSYADYTVNHRFIQSQSDSATYADYLARYDVANPASPAAILGETGKREVTIDSIDINNSVDPKVATVKFSTEVNKGARANWTAVLQFYYSPLVATLTRDPETGAESFQTQDPQFQVVNYALTQAQ